MTSQPRDKTRDSKTCDTPIELTADRIFLCCLIVCLRRKLGYFWGPVKHLYYHYTYIHIFCHIAVSIGVGRSQK